MKSDVNDDFKIRFDLDQIPYWACRYPAEDDFEVEKVIAPQVRIRGYVTKLELLVICHWKTPRSKPLVERNSEGFIKEVTCTALSTSDERLRIEVLTLLTGVSWPTASVLLHFGYSDLYPILDFRALWSLGLEKPPANYDFEFWWKYVQFCRQIALETGVSMRVLDRALWQYSDVNQRQLAQVPTEKLNGSAKKEAAPQGQRI